LRVLKLRFVVFCWGKYQPTAQARTTSGAAFPLLALWAGIEAQLQNLRVGLVLVRSLDAGLKEHQESNWMGSATENTPLVEFLRALDGNPGPVNQDRPRTSTHDPIRKERTSSKPGTISLSASKNPNLFGF
jgi:hypothetical protein